ncbi:MAG: metallophosphoesterase, partial [Mailhella sp.]
VPHLPRELDGLTIAHLSDLHVGSSFTGAWLAKVVQRTNALSPEFIFITGDLADGTPEYVGEALRPLTELRARTDVVICTGNHDYYSGLEPWLNTWKKWELHVLLNSCRHYTVKGRNVCVAAVTDRCAERFTHLPAAMGPPDIKKALEGTKESFVILLSHRPGQAAESAAAGCHLQLSGHTHNGQFFFLFPLVSFLNNGFRSGSYAVGGMALHVSPGTGMWSYIPMRLGTRSEITLLTLQNGGY